MALYFYFNTTTRDLVYSNKAIYDVEGYTSLGEQVNLDPNSESDWVFHSHRITIVTVSKDKSIVGKIAGLTSMGYMFSRCGNLASLDLSGLDTSAVTNMGNMFYGCTKLTSLDVSGFDTSAVTNMNHMFDSCTKLTSIDLSGFDTSAVTSMVSMFYNCNALTDLDLSSFDTSDVTDMRTMFNKCTGLISLDISYFDTSSVTSMYNMFSGCNNLISLDVSGFDTSAVTDMRNMFASCSSLTSLDLSGFDSSTVTSMSGMFYSCARLTSLDLSSFDTLAVTDTSSMFIGCNSLRLITISDKMSNALSQLPADQYYPAAGGSPVAKASLTAGTWVRDEADLTKVTSIVQQAQMSQAISRRIGGVSRDVHELQKSLSRIKIGEGLSFSVWTYPTWADGEFILEASGYQLQVKRDGLYFVDATGSEAVAIWGIKAP